MPRGSKGEKRPADVIGNAFHVMRIATGRFKKIPQPSKAKSTPERADKIVIFCTIIAGA
jgi:hypothetical protein